MNSIIQHKHSGWALALILCFLLIRAWLDNSGLLEENLSLQEELSSIEEDRDALRLKLRSIKADLEHGQTIPHSEVVSLLESELSLMSLHFSDYRRFLGSLLEHAHWYEKNITPFLKSYGAYLSRLAALVKKSPVPLPMISQSASAIETSMKYSENVQRLSSLISTLSARIDAVDAAWLDYQQTHDKKLLTGISSQLGIEFSGEANALLDVLLPLQNVFSLTSETITLIRSSKQALTDPAGKIISDISMLSGFSALDSLVQGSEELDILLSGVSLRTAEFEDDARSLKQNIESDLLAAVRIDTAARLLKPDSQ